MERILTVEQMKSADKYTINDLGISEQELIERAGLAVASEITRRFKGGRVLVCIGKGNNGEDGKVVARVLSSIHGFSVSTLTVSNGIFKMFENKFDIIVDCIFGTGLNKAVEGKYYQAIEYINNSGAFVVSCDIPSGLNADNGYPMGISVKANLTVAIQEYKVGHFINDGQDYCGQTVVKDIGISIWGEDYVRRVTKEDAQKYFPPLKRNVHKGCFGKTVVVGGSKAYSGSIILSKNALCALKTGNGYSAVCVPDSLFNAYVGIAPECLIHTLKDKDGSIVFDKDGLDKLFAYDSIAFGMGIGVSEEIYKSIGYILKNYKGNLVLDADALNTVAKYGKDILLDKACKVLITPHIGEFSRLTGLNKEEILSNAINSAKSFANEYKVTVLLKNAVSVITDGETVYLNTYGCSGMAKAGSGDVLSGLTAGILSKKRDFLESVCVSAMIFGLAGSKRENDYTLTASDIIENLPKVINDL